MMFYFVATEPQIKDQTIMIETVHAARLQCDFFNKYPLGPGETYHIYQAEAVNIREVEEVAP